MKVSLLYVVGVVACASAASLRREPHSVLNALLVARKSVPSGSGGDPSSDSGGTSSGGTSSGGTSSGGASSGGTDSGGPGPSGSGANSDSTCVDACAAPANDSRQCPTDTPQHENNCLCNSKTRADVIACMNCELQNNIYTAQALQETADNIVEACASTNTPIDAIKVGDTSSGMSLKLGNRNDWMPLGTLGALFMWYMS